jgi:hypothetical protein
MSARERKASTASELLAAAKRLGCRDYNTTHRNDRVADISFVSGTNAEGANAEVPLGFAAAQDGLQLTSDNQVEGAALKTDTGRRALCNDTAVERLGRLVLRNLRTRGVVHLLARDQVRSGHVEAVESLQITDGIAALGSEADTVE